MPPLKQLKYAVVSCPFITQGHKNLMKERNHPHHAAVPADTGYI
jgi:hypothetical protein